MTKLINDIKSFDNMQIALLVVASSIFLPFQLFCVVLGTFVAYVLIKCRPYPKWSNGIKYLIAFTAIQVFISALYGNFQGLGVAICLMGVCIYLVFYQANITPLVFKYITGLMIGLSLTVALLGIIEYCKICIETGYPIFEFVIQNEPANRVKSVFYNANLYATICEFVVLLCIYRYVCTTVKKHRIYYVAVALVNFGMIYLTGCRASYLPFLIVFPMYFYLAGKNKLFMVTVFTEILVLIAIGIFPELIPRHDDIESVNARFLIWKRSWEFIKTNYWFGCGPHTYRYMALQMEYYPSQHCHNIYIDFVCSYGVVGIAVISQYLWNLCKDALSYYKKDRHNAMFALIICAFFTICVHGLIDVTILFPNTLMLFMLLINSGCMLFRRG